MNLSKFVHYRNLEMRIEYPYIINHLIKHINENGLTKLKGIQTKVFKAIMGEVNATEMTFISNIIDIEIDEEQPNTIFIVYYEPDKSISRWCLNFDAIIGFKESINHELY